MIVRERDPKHRSGQHRHDRSFQLERLFRVCHCRFFIGFTVGEALSVRYSGSSLLPLQSKPDLSAIAGERASTAATTTAATAAAVRTRTFLARTRFVYG
jgi:hypothetical protein